MADEAAGRKVLKKTVGFLLSMAVTVLAACGGGGSDLAPSAGMDAGVGSGASLTASAPAIPIAVAAEMSKAKSVSGPGLVAHAPDVVNTTTAGKQTFQAIGALTDGGYTIAWLSESVASATSSYYIQRYDLTGAKIGTETQIAFTFDANAHPAIAVLPDGGVVVAFASTRPISTTEPWIVTSGIYTRRFDAAGAPVGGEILVGSLTQNRFAARELHYLTSPQIATWQDGGYVIGWVSVVSNYIDAVNSLATQRFDSLGQPVGSAANFASAGSENNITFQLLAIEGSGYVVGITHRFMGELYVVFHIVGESGVTAHVGTSMNANLGLPVNETTLLPLREGGFALWSRNVDGPYLQVYDPLGSPAGAPTPLSALPELASTLADGGYVLFSKTTTFGQLSGQRFDAAGAPVGEPFMVQTDGWSPVAVPLAGGGLTLGWTRPGDGVDMDVIAQQFDAPDAGLKPWQLQQRACLVEAKNLTGAEHKQFMSTCRERGTGPV